MIPNFELRFLFGSEDLRAAKGYRGSPLRSCMSPRAGRNCFRTPPPKLTHTAPAVPVTWLRGWRRPWPWEVHHPALGPPAGRGASGCGAAAGTGRPGGRGPCERSQGTAVCVSSCTVGGRGAAGGARPGLCTLGGGPTCSASLPPGPEAPQARAACTATIHAP